MDEDEKRFEPHDRRGNDPVVSHRLECHCRHGLREGHGQNDDNRTDTHLGDAPPLVTEELKIIPPGKDQYAENQSRDDQAAKDYEVAGAMMSAGVGPDRPRPRRNV